MTAVRIEIDTRELNDAFGRALDVALNPRPLLEATGDLLIASTHRRFDTGHGPDGIPWPPSGRVRSAAVPKKGARGRNRMGPRHGGKTLVDSGALRESIGKDVQADQVHVGVERHAPGDAERYAATHQFGAHIEPRKGEFLVFTGADGGLVFAREVDIPARPFLGIDDQDQRDIADLWGKAFQQALSEGGGR